MNDFFGTQEILLLVAPIILVSLARYSSKNRTGMGKGLRVVSTDTSATTDRESAAGLNPSDIIGFIIRAAIVLSIGFFIHKYIWPELGQYSDLTKVSVLAFLAIAIVGFFGKGGQIGKYSMVLVIIGVIYIPANEVYMEYKYGPDWEDAVAEIRKQDQLRNVAEFTGKNKPSSNPFPSKVFSVKEGKWSSPVYVANVCMKVHRESPGLPKVNVQGSTNDNPDTWVNLVRGTKFRPHWIRCSSRGPGDSMCVVETGPLGTCS